LELCSFQKEKDEIATKLRKEASEKYGDIPQGLEANKAKLEYNEKRQKEEFSKLYKTYNISDSVGNLVLLLSMKYCN
jgi:membrane protein insertase Oxa1/YidC/SpoIIIJ